MSFESIEEYYASNNEDTRLLRGLGQLEFARTNDIVDRHLPKPPAVILDVGGGTGRYACRFASLGYTTHLVDASETLLKKAKENSAKQIDTPLASCSLGDARHLNFGDNFANAVLLLGPLYHLTEKKDRILALKEANRVLVRGGILFAAGISRFASVIDGLAHEYILDNEFKEMAESDLVTGQHRNHTEKIGYFTKSFFHLPLELKAEVEEAGYRNVRLFSIESIAFLMGNFESYWKDIERRAILLSLMRSLENEESLLGATAHLLCVGYKE